LLSRARVGFLEEIVDRFKEQVLKQSIVFIQNALLPCVSPEQLIDNE
jgi:hypothetical protein